LGFIFRPTYSSPITVSAASKGPSGPKRTRREEQGATGHTPAMVADSWMEKPGGFSIGMALRMPPRFGALGQGG
jgi:hypothetical protein